MNDHRKSPIDLVETKGDEVFVKLKYLPSYAELRNEVNQLVAKLTWFEKYAYDNAVLCSGLLCNVGGMYLMSTYDSLMTRFIPGFLLYALGHSILTSKGGHLAAHGSLAESRSYNRFLTWLFVEFFGSFSTKVGYDIHIKCHHPHTNIIGQGDSSTWKQPMLPSYVYMLIAPLFMPLVTPLVALDNLRGQWTETGKYVLWSGLGFLSSAFLPLVYYGKFSPLTALFIIFSGRALLSPCYIHFNIFQHIGLPMYSPENRPARIYQMSSGALNLARNPFLDFVFGHSLINCHVEHHLFPHLSDSMCLKVKPLVSSFLLKHGLPYHEKPYSERFRYFINNYDRLMVNAPPMTHYVGLQ